ncbi:MAG: type VI secretion system baseplate subunit TssG [Deltaproteobacteria bacterium]|nr:MAG: type VI secretion system baseplate subunit TssG [Deltaproteobacteria bacterium]
MADQTGKQTSDLNLAFLENPIGLNFFQAARRVECQASHRPRLGTASRSVDDPIQFCQEPSLIFAPSTLSRLERQKLTGKPRLMVYFMGLLGPHGPMPLHITDYVHDRIQNHDDLTLARFLDIFNHRMISLFYRAWACNRQTVSYDRPETDRFSTYVGSLFGIGHASLRNRDAVPDKAKLHYAGHLACQTRNAYGLRRILETFFGIATAIREFIGQWIILPDAYRCRLGGSPDNATLGVNAVVGSRVWDCQSKFRIVMGPANLADYERILPGTRAFSQLKAWVRNYVGDALSWDVQLILKAEEVPAIRLGEAGRLGWTTWLNSRPFEDDVGDMIIEPEAV